MNSRAPFGWSFSSKVRPPQAAVLPVGEDVQDLASSMPRLHPAPEVRAQQVAVRFEKDLAHLPLEPHEGEEFLREEDAIPHVDPRFRRELLVEVAGPRHVAEVA